MQLLNVRGPASNHHGALCENPLARIRFARHHDSATVPNHVEPRCTSSNGRRKASPQDERYSAKLTHHTLTHHMMLHSVNDLAVIELRQFHDSRGLLVSVELLELISFPVRRLFWIRDVPVDTVRGGHGHKLCQQFMICIAGALSIEVFDGTDTRVFALYAGQALLVPPAIFSSEKFTEPDSVLLVLCDRPYETDDYLTTRELLLNFRERSSVI